MTAYLLLAADEPESRVHARSSCRPSARPGSRRAYGCPSQIAKLLRTWRHRTRLEHRDWPAVPDGRYPAAIGAVHDLLSTPSASGDAERAPNLREDAVSAVLALLEIPTAG